MEYFFWFLWQKMDLVGTVKIKNIRLQVNNFEPQIFTCVQSDSVFAQ